MARIPASLRALLSRLIDYAGLYPPAALPLSEVREKYLGYLASPESWMLNRIVLPVSRLAEAAPGADWRVTLLVEDEPGQMPACVESLETRQARKLSLPTYCEAALESIPAGAFAKVRTGGPTADAIPPADAVAEFLCAAAARRLPFKATAGLHHPIRSVMHGFINVFAAAVFAWGGADRALVLNILNDGEPDSFRFHDDAMLWQGRAVSTSAMRAARKDFAHSFGSCSFEEPLADLRELGWLA